MAELIPSISATVAIVGKKVLIP